MVLGVSVVKPEGKRSQIFCGVNELHLRVCCKDPMTL
jgi:hypothetical protein